MEVKDSLTAHSLPHPLFVHVMHPMCVPNTSSLVDSANPCFLKNEVYDWAKKRLDYLAAVAVFHNSQHDVNWVLHDSDGDVICVWGGGTFPCNWWLLNHSPWCPRGKWTGEVRKGSMCWEFGSTEGMTVTGWMCSVARDSLFAGEAFLDAFTGVDCEDGPGRDIPCWGGYKPGGGAIAEPDPKNDGVGIPCDAIWNPWQAYADSCLPSVDSLFTEFLQVLRDSVGQRPMKNGHGLKWYVGGTGTEDTMVTNTFMGGKLEDFGKWGGWPYSDSTNAYWWWVYKGMEEVYYPVGVDSLEGWDYTIIESLPFADDNSGTDWSVAMRDRWTRLNLGISLLGDGYFSGQAYKEDFEFYEFLRGSTTYAPFRIPEIDFKFSGAVGDYGVYAPFGVPRYVLYRQFYREENSTSVPYTVVVNPRPLATGGVPARDAQWFRGHHSTFPQPDSLLVFDHWAADRCNPSGGTATAASGVSVERLGRTGTRILFQLPRAGNTHLAVYDANGRLVRTLVDQFLARGSHTASWDGRDERGQPTARGLYFWSLRGIEVQAEGRLLLIR